MCFTRGWRNMRHFVRQGHLLKFQDSNIQTFSRCLLLKARTLNMHENISKSKTSDTDSNNTSESPNTLDEGESCLNVASKKKRDSSDDSEKLAGVPEDFSEMERQIFVAHKNAIEANYDTYKDPLTGYDVFTRETLLNRGKCCGNACRHCPYGHINVPEQFRTKKFNSQFYI